MGGTDHETPKSWDAIVVGAGFAGLAAAETLSAAGRSVLLLEARERVGGRVKPATIAGRAIDLGGMWMGPTQTRLKKRAENFQLQAYPQYIRGKTITHLLGRTAKAEADIEYALFNIAERLDLARVARKIERLAKTLPLDAPWQARDAHALDAITLESWLQKNAYAEKTRALMREITKSLFCADTSQLSMLFFLFYTKSGGGLDVMTSMGPGGAQNFLFDGGVHQLAIKMSEAMDAKLLLNAPVTAIRYEETGVYVEARSSEWRAKQVILAVPPPLAAKIRFSPALPSIKAGLFRRQVMGSVIKFWVAYPEPFWREDGLDGMIFSDSEPASAIFDASPPDGALGLLSGFFDSSPATNLWSPKGQDGRRQAMIKTLTRFFGDKAQEPLDYLDNDWTREPWSEGGYSAYMPPGVLSHYGAALREPVGPIHWAGTETATEWTGYIDGALQSGDRAAGEILAL